MPVLHVRCLKLFPHALLLLGQLFWRYAASLLLRLLSLAPIGLVLYLAPVRLLLLALAE